MTTVHSRKRTIGSLVVDFEIIVSVNEHTLEVAFGDGGSSSLAETRRRARRHSLRRRIFSRWTTRASPVRARMSWRVTYSGVLMDWAIGCDYASDFKYLNNSGLVVCYG